MTPDSKVDLKNLSPQAMIDFLAGVGKEKFRAGQIMRWIYQRNVTDFAAMTDLAKSFREELIGRARVSHWTPEAVEVSRDGTRKYLFRLEDGKTVESVLIPMENERNTLCISTQVGCAMQCSFCLTGTFGLERNLEVGEIVNQVCAVRAEYPVDNIVMMGMGEPLHNLENVVRALEILYAEAGCNYGPRKVTLSTAGLVPQMYELARRIKVNLAVSLNATTDEVRDQLRKQLQMRLKDIKVMLLQQQLLENLLQSAQKLLELKRLHLIVLVLNITEELKRSQMQLAKMVWISKVSLCQMQLIQNQKQKSYLKSLLP